LRGISVNTSQYYTENLQMDSLTDLQWLGELGLPYEAAKKDATERNIPVDEYLATVEHALLTFRKSGEVHDREDFYNFLNGSVKDPKIGRFCLVLGGKSVGKSLVLGDFAKQLLNSSAFYPLLLDARDSPRASLSDLILGGYKQLSTVGIGGMRFTQTDIRYLLGVVLDVLPKAMDLPLPWSALLDRLKQGAPSEASRIGGFFDYLLFRKEELPPEAALQSFVNFGHKINKHPVLIIDEANLIIGKDNDHVAITSTLATMVKLTKQSNNLTVILASSEYGYPYKLVGKDEEKPQFNLIDLTSILFAGEIPPKSMWDLLVTKTKTGSHSEKVIGMGENLASLLIASYGGHFLQLSLAVESLNAYKEQFAVADGLNPISAGIVACFNLHPTETLSLLRQLAMFGFVVIANPDDPAVKMIVRKNLGGIVSREKSRIVGQPRSVWSGTTEKYGLVPTSESARLVMAEFVVNKEKEKML
jgi:hypothetical protein